MFGKLLKNDLKAQWSSMRVILFGILAIFIICELAITLADSEVVKALGGLAVIAVMFFACIFILISVGVSYSKAMFGRAGYLTLTIPVKTSKLIWSKTVTGLIWIFSVYALVIISTVLWVYQMLSIVGTEDVQLADDLFGLVGLPSMSVITAYIISIAVTLAIEVLLLVQVIYFSETLSHVNPFSKLGKIGTLIFFFAILILLEEIISFISGYLPMGMVFSQNQIIFTSNINSTLEKLNSSIFTQMNLTIPLLRFAAAVGLSFPITYLVKNEVNVK